MPTKTKNANTATGGTPGGAGTNTAATGAGSAFRMPKYSTRRRHVVDSRNKSVAVAPQQASQIGVPLTSFDQLDIVQGWTATVTGLQQTWTAGSGKTLTVSPFFPASQFKQLNVQLQAAYNAFNLTGPLAQLIQAYRPVVGWRKASAENRNPFATPQGSVPVVTTAGTLFVSPSMTIDIPIAWPFDEYYDLDVKGNPRKKVYDAIVTPAFMAAQARQVQFSCTLAPGIGALDALGAPVASASGDTTSTYVDNVVGAMRLSRNAWWTSKNSAANPPQYPWQYTRDYFSQAVSGQSPVSVLLQNTGVSVGQLMSVYGFVWDPALNSGIGGVVPMTSIAYIRLVTGGSLINYDYTPAEITNMMTSLYGNALSGFPSGCFVLDWALREDGGYLTNEGLINTYLVNGVAVEIGFTAGNTPSASATVYVGTEALKYATS